MQKKIERQAKDAKLFNVDVRPEQKWMAERGIFPCSNGDGKFDLDFEIPLSLARVEIKGNFFDQKIERIVFSGKELSGMEDEIIKDFLSLVDAMDPDVILMSGADFWIWRIQNVASKLGLKNTISRTDSFF